MWAEFSETGGHEAAHKIIQKFNEIRKSCKWPKDWCNAVLVMIPKEGNLKCCAVNAITFNPCGFGEETGKNGVG